MAGGDNGNTNGENGNINGSAFIENSNVNGSASANTASTVAAPVGIGNEESGHDTDNVSASNE
ncbi:hypothetical protein E2562_033097 [Oryza meyeriana var. granulata]|uniref:Uncharacterized protein n=1 Tax=Oryza meyeriana var. granulata TaxID=110450 RepID=A0A6G1ES26_9ORYZ|nr:hypothetical protein E2562_033097 [Oryza meyeriana var. granulata]